MLTIFQYYDQFKKKIFPSASMNFKTFITQSTQFFVIIQPACFRSTISNLMEHFIFVLKDVGLPCSRGGIIIYLFLTLEFLHLQ